jgi:hypothetical protein
MEKTMVALLKDTTMYESSSSSGCRLMVHTWGRGRGRRGRLSRAEGAAGCKSPEG